MGKKERFEILFSFHLEYAISHSSLEMSVRTYFTKSDDVYNCALRFGFNWEQNSLVQFQKRLKDKEFKNSIWKDGVG